MKVRKKLFYPIILKYLSRFLKIALKPIIPKTKIPFKRAEIKKVLVYAYTGLGNFVLFTPTLKIIKEHLAQANFTLLHGNDTGCHEVVEGSDLFDKYIVINRNANWWVRIKWIYKIRKEKYDLIISEFHNNNLFIALLTILSGAPYRLGHVTSPGWNNDWDWIYNIPVKMKENQHEIDRYLELAYAIDIPRQKVNKKPFIYISRDDKNFARKFLAFHGIDKNKDRIVSVQLGTSPAMGWKQWELDKYKELCDRICELPNTKVILHGSLNEVKMVRDVVNKMNNKPIIAAGKTTIKQVAAIIEMSDLLICNDSGLMHIAVAVDTPVVAIYGPTDYTRTAPLGKKHTIIRKNLDCSPCFRLEGTEKVENCPYNRKCLKLITVDEVFQVVQKKLQEIKNSNEL